MLFLVLNFKIVETIDDFVFNLKRVKEQKCWKYQKIRSKLFKLCKSLSWISDEKLKRLIFQIFQQVE